MAAFGTGAGLPGCAAPPSNPARPAPPLAPGLQAAVDAARADAAQRSGLAAAAFTVESAAEVTWPDGSLGCPQPGRMYTQALVPGVRIVLVADGRRFIYHGDRRGRVGPCPEAQAQPPLAEGGGIR